MNFRLATASVGMGVFFGLVLWLHQRDAAPPEEAYVKPNIIFLSFCSMRSQDLGIYNNLNKNITPNIDENFQHGFIFKNAFTSYGWTNMSSYLFQNFNYSFLSENGYEALGSEPSSLVYWIPKPILLNQKKPMVVEQYTNQIVDGLKNLKDLILTKRQKPFFAFVHIKYMHYPYIDLTNPNSNWDIYLTENEKSYVRDIIYSPKKFPNNILMPLILYGSNKILDSYPQIQSKAASPITRFFDQYQLFSDQALVQKWRKTDNFENDLLLIKKIYRAKLHFLDQQIGDLLNLYGDLRLQENTIIILTGDHGESFLEHDTLGHAAKVNDEIMNFVIKCNIGKCLIPETCWFRIFEIARLLNESNVKCYAIPNIEIVRKDELYKHNIL